MTTLLISNGLSLNATYEYNNDISLETFEIVEESEETYVRGHNTECDLASAYPLIDCVSTDVND